MTFGNRLIHRRFAGMLMASAAFACLTLPSSAFAVVPLPKPHPAKKAAQAAPVSINPKTAPADKQGLAKQINPAGTRGAIAAPPPPPAPQRARPAARMAVAATTSTSQADLEILSQVIRQTKDGSAQAATATAAALRDPLALKLAEWLILRSEDNGAPTERYLAFIANNPSWPSISFFKRRVEATLWDDKRDAILVADYFARNKPMTAKGYFALARVLSGRGDNAGAARQVRLAWRNERFAAALEAAALAEFGEYLSAADHRGRMDLLLSYEDKEGGLRNARRAGGDAPAIATARIAVISRAVNAKALLDGLPQSSHSDPGYIFSRAQWLRRNDKTDEAARVMLSAPTDPARLVNLNEWWIERRVLIRQLLDAGDPRMAYRIARDAVRPDKETYHTDKEFTAGWIALRFLNDPATAITHFSRIDDHTSNPTALARAGYWMGRALEAMGRGNEAREAYARGAAHPTSYYGQLARARLNMPSLELHAPPRGAADSGENFEVVRAAELLYAVDEPDMVIPILAEVGEYGDVAAIAALAQVVEKAQDARGLLILAKDAVNRGLPFDTHAYPTFGLPRVRQIGPDIDPAVVYAIARQESGFNPRVVSPANAMGLMQVTPAAGRYVAKKFGVEYDGKRLLNDQVYNVQLGSAELADLLKDYNGSYIMTFTGYNAGRGRVRQWIQRYGDPRDPSVDAVDWIERIPFAETRNYVQRILENMQVYRARLGGGQRLRIEADLAGGRSTE